MRVFKVADEAASWNEQSYSDTAARIFADISGHSGWSRDSIAHYEQGDTTTIVWRRWHAMQYKYTRLIDKAYGIDRLSIRPDYGARGGTWVSDHPMGFIRSIRYRVADLFAMGNMNGVAIIMRPGQPAPATFYRIPAYDTVVRTHKLPKSHGTT